ncbi:MAG: N-acetylmuramoyl-L-alanine amidase, partial [Thermoplasmatales archaeon]|nr:N-acetylmuramoyl-L-alanine amidase [Thermoplasmatales archaeon]
MKKAFCLLITLFFIIQMIEIIPGGKPENIDTPPDTTYSAKTAKTLTGYKICIDPGHGGSDPGAAGYDGDGYPNEKDFTLDIGLRLRDLLEGDGATVIMTRETDKAVNDPPKDVDDDGDIDQADELQARCNIANENNTNISVSIHFNSAVESAHGTETFYWEKYDLSTYSAEGKNLSDAVQAELVSRLGLTDRGSKKDYSYFGYNLYVLNHTTMPAVLTEIAFISNQTEFSLSNTSVFRQDAVISIYHGICEYFKVTPKDYPPFIEITWPENNSDVEGEIKISADVTDDFGVGWVRMKINDDPWQWDSTPPHEWTWESRDVENGSYTIMAEANDTVDNRANKTVTVNVTNQHFTLQFNTGWNLITLPLNTTYDRAGDLAASILNCTHIGKWNTSAQEFEMYEKSVDNNNFTLQNGIGYIVYTNTSSQIVLSGTNITSATINLNIGWNSIGWHNFTKTKAENLGQNITNCTAVAYWNVTLSRFIVHPVSTDIS